MVNKDKYTVDYNLQMDNADEKLLEEDVLAPQDSKRYNFKFIFYLQHKLFYQKQNQWFVLYIIVVYNYKIMSK